MNDAKYERLWKRFTTAEDRLVRVQILQRRLFEIYRKVSRRLSEEQKRREKEKTKT